MTVKHNIVDGRGYGEGPDATFEHVDDALRHTSLCFQKPPRAFGLSYQSSWELPSEWGVAGGTLNRAKRASCRRDQAPSGRPKSVLQFTAPGFGRVSITLYRTYMPGLQALAKPRATASSTHLRMLDAQQQTLMAYLLVRAKRVSAMPQRSLGALIEATITMLGHSEIRPAGALQPPSDAEDPRAVTVDGWIGGVIGDGTLGTAPITLRLGFMERDNVLFTLALCSPKLENDPLTAFRATRAFELARLTTELLK